MNKDDQETLDKSRARASAWLDNQWLGQFAMAALVTCDRGGPRQLATDTFDIAEAMLAEFKKRQVQE